MNNQQENITLKDAKAELGDKIETTRCFTEIPPSMKGLQFRYSVQEVMEQPEIYNRLSEEQKLIFMIGMPFPPRKSLEDLKQKAQGELLYRHELNQKFLPNSEKTSYSPSDNEIKDMLPEVLVEEIDRREQIMMMKATAFLALRCGITEVGQGETRQLDILTPDGKYDEVVIPIKDATLFDHSMLVTRIAEENLFEGRGDTWTEEHRMALVAGVVLHDNVKQANFMTHHFDSAVVAEDFLNQMYEHNPQALPFSGEGEEAERQEFMQVMREAIDQHSGYSLYMNKVEMQNFLTERFKQALSVIRFNGQKLYQIVADNYDNDRIAEMFANAKKEGRREPNEEEFQEAKAIRENCLQHIQTTVEEQKDVILEGVRQAGLPDDYIEVVQDYYRKEAEAFLNTYTILEFNDEVQYTISAYDFFLEKQIALEKEVMRNSSISRKMVADYIEIAGKEGLEEARLQLPKHDSGANFIGMHLDRTLPAPESEVAIVLAESDNVQLCTPIGQEKIIKIVIGASSSGEELAECLEMGVSGALESALENLSLFEEGSLSAELAIDSIITWVLTTNEFIKEEYKENIRREDLQHTLKGENDFIFQALLEGKNQGKQAFIEMVKRWSRTNLQPKSAESMKIAYQGTGFPEESFPEPLFGNDLLTKEEQAKFLPSFWVQKVQEIFSHYKYEKGNDNADPQKLEAVLADLKPFYGRLKKEDWSDDYGAYFCEDLAQYHDVLVSIYENKGERGEKWMDEMEQVIGTIHDFYKLQNPKMTNKITKRMVVKAREVAQKYELSLADSQFEFVWPESEEFIKYQKIAGEREE